MASPLDNCHALLIGVSRYQNIQQFPTVSDVRDLAAVLINPLHCGYPGNNVHVLEGQDASRASILEGLVKLARDVGPDATVFVYFSGHGDNYDRAPRSGSTYCLLTPSTRLPKTWPVPPSREMSSRVALMLSELVG